ncbi:MAG: Arc family DNA-binding protein [Acidimicrobiales bacterium]
MTVTAPTASTTHQFPLRLPKDTYETLRAAAAATGESANALIISVLEEYLRANRKQLIDLIARAANERHSTVLDKLAGL